MSNNDWAAVPTRVRAEAEPDVNHVFSNFKGGRQARPISEAEARDRSRRKGDRMQGVVVEVKRSRTGRQDPVSSEATGLFRL